MRRSFVLLSLLCCGTPSLASDTHAFEARSVPEVGSTWKAKAQWASTGHTLVSLGFVKLRDRPSDDSRTYECEVELLAVSDGEKSKLSLRFSEASERGDDGAVSLRLDGRTVLATGKRGERSFRFDDGKRLNKAQTAFVEVNWGGDDEEERQMDMHTLLLPPGPVEVGQVWTLPLDDIVRDLGGEDVVLDPLLSRGTGRLLAVDERLGVPFGLMEYDIVIVPQSIPDVEFEQARITIDGTAELPIKGSVPYYTMDLDVGILFTGAVKRMGVKANIALNRSVTTARWLTPIEE